MYRTLSTIALSLLLAVASCGYDDEEVEWDCSEDYECRAGTCECLTPGKTNVECTDPGSTDADDPANCKNKCRVCT